jgi:macrodomain Ter protein organizer (MatP/YcbG family)
MTIAKHGGKRPGAGRKSGTVIIKDEALRKRKRSLSISDQTWTQLLNRSKAEGKSVSEVIENLLK